MGGFFQKEKRCYRFLKRRFRATICQRVRIFLFAHPFGEHLDSFGSGMVKELARAFI